MELLLEVLLWLAGTLLEVVAEVGLQAIFELLARTLTGGIARRHRLPDGGPWLAALGYGLLGAACGGVSLLIFPELFVRGAAGRWANLLLTPLACGSAMALLGGWLERHDRQRTRLDGFLFGALFALAMSAVRMGFGR